MDYKNNLHSTIFILKLKGEIYNAFITVFTFYYIYIKTYNKEMEDYLETNLHSTIFILKLRDLWNKRRNRKICILLYLY